MTGARAERWAILGTRLLAASFAVVGLLFIVIPGRVTSSVDPA